jgi:hypothetical protein
MLSPPAVHGTTAKCRTGIRPGACGSNAQSVRRLNHKESDRKMTHICIPTASPEDWKWLLADPEKQWKAGCSAYTLAQAREAAQDFPPSLRRVLEQDPTLRGAELLLALPEHKIPLLGGSRPTQTDLWVLARLDADAGLLSIAVEGKVEEPFGPMVEQWLVGASAGKRERLAYLVGLLGLEGEDLAPLRYQLLHRTAAAMIEARCFQAQQAMMMVHSFSQEETGFADYAAFVARFGAEAQVNGLCSARERSGVGLWFAWVKG